MTNDLWTMWLLGFFVGALLVATAWQIIGYLSEPKPAKKLDEYPQFSDDAQNFYPNTPPEDICQCGHPRYMHYENLKSCNRRNCRCVAASYPEKKVGLAKHDNQV